MTALCAPGDFANMVNAAPHFITAVFGLFRVRSISKHPKGEQSLLVEKAAPFWLSLRPI